MKLLPILLAWTLLSCASSGPPPEKADQPAAEAPAAKGSSRVIDVATLHADLASVPVLIDVRTAREYGGGHVPGALNLPVQELGARMAELAEHKGDTVYVICQSGGRSRAATAQLVDAGFTVVDVQGGTGAWKAAGYPVE